MMVSVMVLLAVVVSLLTVLVIGLLRSYGEVLRRLHDAGLAPEGTAAAPKAPDSRPISTSTVGLPRESST